ncbi:MAG: hypothetical protein D6674_03180 [Acidobacteria bacterium]|jgi:hypothetical protein|nr:MAG: hypothetical protein D6674_03180 [Acidobacteriota bacterium]
MKALLVLHSKLIQEKDWVQKLSNKVSTLKRLIGPDSIYAVITSEMKNLIDLFPDLVFIRNDKGTLLYGIYKGLRKLRGNDVLVLNAAEELSNDKLKEFISKRRKNIIYAINSKWKGVALFRLVDLDYLIRTIEGYIGEEVDFLNVIERLKGDYGIEYETL